MRELEVRSLDGGKIEYRLVCRACGHRFRLQSPPDAGCTSPSSIPAARLVADGRCERCFVRDVDASTCGSPNQRMVP